MSHCSRPNNSSQCDRLMSAHSRTRYIDPSIARLRHGLLPCVLISARASFSTPKTARDCTLFCPPGDCIAARTVNVSDFLRELSGDPRIFPSSDRSWLIMSDLLPDLFRTILVFLLVVPLLFGDFWGYLRVFVF